MQGIVAVEERRHGRPGQRSLVQVAVTTALAFTVAVAHADEPDARVQAYAQRLAIGVCGSCHGPHGNSEQPKFPRLAGQNANYLVAQLKAFRAEKRGDPDAIGYMWGMARQLDDATIEALASYYSKQTPSSGNVGDQALIARGKGIFEQGVESEGVPMCASCHGPDAHGTADFPRLAGQHAQYILKQLRAFQSNMRDVAVMHGVALNLREQEMEAVAEYLQAAR
jgi:cytochrome c553